MTPEETTKPENRELGEARLGEILSRLKQVQRRCADDSDVGEPGTLAKEALASIVLELEAALGPGGGHFDLAELDLALGTVEELFEAAGSQRYSQVVGSVRDSLPQELEDGVEMEEPPAPQKFRPPPSAAKIRRRPLPKPKSNKVRAAPKAESGGGIRLVWIVLVIIVVGAAGLIYRDRVLMSDRQPGPGDRTKVDRSQISRRVVAEESRPDPILLSTEEEDQFDEEVAAQFTLAIRLSQRALDDKDISLALKHFAAAATIDRHHRRVVAMGKLLIAAMLQDADWEYDNGRVARAGRRVQDARQLARGLRLDDSAVDHTAEDPATKTHFEDVDPGDEGAFRGAVGHPVRATLKSRDVIFGHLQGIEGHLLRLVVYSGVGGGGVDSSTVIPVSTVRQLRIYDAEIPEETVEGD